MTTMLSAESLAAIALFREIPLEALEILARRGGVQSIAPGERLFAAGDTPRGLIVVLAGRIRVVQARDGRLHVLHEEGPGGTLGEVPLFASGTYPATAEAVEPSTCAVLPREVLLAAIASHPPLAFVLLERLARRVRAFAERIDQVTTRSVRERLAAFVLARTLDRGAARASLGMTQQRLAEELGTVREVVVRELARLKKSGVVALSRDGIVDVLDADALRDAAGRG